jgi:hypothetical protein
MLVQDENQHLLQLSIRELPGCLSHGADGILDTSVEPRWADTNVDKGDAMTKKFGHQR